jgi:hypothetical protein
MRLVNRVESILSSNQSSAHSKQGLQDRLQMLRNSMNRIEQENNKNAEVILPVLKQIHLKATQALERNDLFMANELLDLVQRQINNLVKRSVN